MVMATPYAHAFASRIRIKYGEDLRFFEKGNADGGLICEEEGDGARGEICQCDLLSAS
jgi:hypothetical protein